MATYPILPIAQPEFPFGVLHSPFVIAIRNRSLGDAEILEWLNCSQYEPRPAAPFAFPRVYVGQDEHWTLVADDWAYTLRHRCGERRLERGARWGEMFSFWVGDSDESYGFSHYVDGTLQRAYHVDSPQFSDRIVVYEEGPPLPGESEALREKDGMVIVWVLAESLGIETDHRRKRFRCYGQDGLWP